MKLRTAVAGLGLIALAVGLFLGLRSIESGTVGCGSAFSPDYYSAMLIDSGMARGGYEQNCRDAVSAARPFAFGVTGIGALLLAGSLFVPGDRRISAQ